MKLSELESKISKLKFEYGDIEIMILDGFNGQGVPRDINYQSTHLISFRDAVETADREGRAGEYVAILGYGCY